MDFVLFLVDLLFWIFIILKFPNNNNYSLIALNSNISINVTI